MPMIEYKMIVQSESFPTITAGLRSAVGSGSHSRARGPGFDTRSGHILSFLLPPIQDRQLLLAKVCAQSPGLPLRRSKPAKEKFG